MTRDRPSAPVTSPLLSPGRCSLSSRFANCWNTEPFSVYTLFPQMILSKMMVLNINLYESNVQIFTSTFHLFSEHQTLTCKVFWASPCGCLIEISHLTCPRENSCFALRFLFFSSPLLHLRKWCEPPTKASSHLWSPSFLYIWLSNLKEISESVSNPSASAHFHYSKACPTSVWSSLLSVFCPLLLACCTVVRAVRDIF